MPPHACSAQGADSDEIDALMQLYAALEEACEERLAAASEAGLLEKEGGLQLGWMDALFALKQTRMDRTTLPADPLARPSPSATHAAGPEREAALQVQDALRYRLTRLVSAALHGRPGQQLQRRCRGGRMPVCGRRLAGVWCQGAGTSGLALLTAHLSRLLPTHLSCRPPTRRWLTHVCR